MGPPQTECFINCLHVCVFHNLKKKVIFLTLHRIPNVGMTSFLQSGIIHLNKAQLNCYYLLYSTFIHLFIYFMGRKHFGFVFGTDAN